jgi:hypothetical protein
MKIHSTTSDSVLFKIQSLKIAEGIKRLAQALTKYLAHLAKERLAHSLRQRRNEHVLI